MKLKTYIWDIFMVGKTNNVDIGVARDMFICNMERGENQYPGANVNYAALGAKWKALPLDEQTHQKNEYSRITHECNKLFHPAWKAKDRTKFDAILAAVEDE